MNYWIFVIKDRQSNGRTLTSKEIMETRMHDKFWGLRSNVNNRLNLRMGDKGIIYQGVPEKKFSANFTISSNVFKMNDDLNEEFSHGMELYRSEYGVKLDEISIWNTPKSADDLIQSLGFIENKDFWGTYFQGGIRQITEEDYKIIMGERTTTLVEDIGRAMDLESQSDFALEGHLEEFLFNNWDTIKWGSNIKLYKDVEEDGRQFPAGVWSIDFLAVDQDTNELVVIELKRGKTSDATIGQIMRYMGWVRKNLALENQGVKGIIIAKDFDDALIYGIDEITNIRLMKYRVDFKLIPYQNNQ